MEQSFRAAELFTDHMVLQQETRVPVWGTGRNGTTVEIFFQDQVSCSIIENGTWKVVLEPMKAGGPYTMKIRSAGQSLLFQDVWIGEVWLAAGQSNMVQQLLFTEGGVEEADRADQPMIRFYRTPRRPFPEAEIPGWDFMGTYTSPDSWKVCTPPVAALVTAIGFHFAKLLQQAHDVPVGIIDCSCGATGVQAWMDESYLRGDSELAGMWENYEKQVNSLDPTIYESQFSKFVQDMNRLIAERGDIEARVREMGLEGYRAWIKKNPLVLPEPPAGPKAYYRPCGLYHSMLKTVMPYSIRGVLWYQGESNAIRDEVALYKTLLTAMILNWHTEWNRDDLPFLLVQLSSFCPLNGTNGNLWAYIREAQQEVADSVPNVSLVPTLDLGEHDIHPIYKRQIGERLFRAAQSNVYGREKHYGPTRLKTYSIKNNKFHIVVDQDKSYLKAVSGGETESGYGPLSGFLICGEDGKFQPAYAFLVGEEIEVYHPKVESPTAIRYAWQNMPEYSLFGRYGLPVSSFRTDDYPPST